MAWRDHKRPRFKVCKGYNRKPHKCMYDKDFPMHKRVFKSGKVAWYAGPLCWPCRRAYERELRRMDSKLAGKPGTLGDIQLAVKMVKGGSSLRQAAAAARVARQTIKNALANPTRYERERDQGLMIVDLEQFTKWFEDYLDRTNQSATSFLDSAEIRQAAWFAEIPAAGSITVKMAERFFIAADEPWMMSHMEELGAVHWGERQEAA